MSETMMAETGEVVAEGAGEGRLQVTAEELVDALFERFKDAERRAQEFDGLIETGTLEVASIALVSQFHEAFDVETPAAPCVPDADVQALRLRLLAEEQDELRRAFEAGDMVAIADALADLQVVLDGTFLVCGLGAAKRHLVAEVHGSNMSKLGGDGRPVLRDDGKILKGEGYTPPDIAGVLAAVYGDGEDGEGEAAEQAEGAA